jgi:hypothetical protein
MFDNTATKGMRTRALVQCDNLSAAELNSVPDVVKC